MESDYGSFPPVFVQRLKTALTGRGGGKGLVVSDSPVNALPYPVLGPFFRHTAGNMDTVFYGLRRRETSAISRIQAIKIRVE